MKHILFSEKKQKKAELLMMKTGMTYPQIASLLEIPLDKFMEWIGYTSSSSSEERM